MNIDKKFFKNMLVSWLLLRPVKDELLKELLSCWKQLENRPSIWTAAFGVGLQALQDCGPERREVNGVGVTFAPTYSWRRYPGGSMGRGTLNLTRQSCCVEESGKGAWGGHNRMCGVLGRRAPQKQSPMCLQRGLSSPRGSADVFTREVKFHEAGKDSPESSKLNGSQSSHRR